MELHLDTATRRLFSAAATVAVTARIHLVRGKMTQVTPNRCRL
jgi:hypothetical protein